MVSLNSHIVILSDERIDSETERGKEECRTRREQVAGAAPFHFGTRRTLQESSERRPLAANDALPG